MFFAFRRRSVNKYVRNATLICSFLRLNDSGLFIIYVLPVSKTRECEPVTDK